TMTNISQHTNHHEPVPHADLPRGYAQPAAQDVLPMLHTPETAPQKPRIICSSEQLQKRMGEKPKGDIQIGGKKLFERSARYKAVIKALDIYNTHRKALKTRTAPVTQNDIHQLRIEVQDIRSACDDYIETHQGKKGDAVKVGVMQEQIDA